MNIRTAILKAADSIERHPELFDFDSTAIPDCGTPGCALGWIAFHLGEYAFNTMPHKWNTMKLGKALCLTDEASGINWAGLNFYRRLSCIVSGWKDDASLCAKALRLYADKFHPETDHIPESVRTIFESVERSHA